MQTQTHSIGFIGQGWIGKNYADNFESRGYKVVRYSNEPEHIENQNAITECDIVFIAVPTPTTPKGFDDTIVRTVLSHIGVGKVAVIKSTIVPGTTAKIQSDFPDIIILYAPEFLSEATVVNDIANPFINMIGLAKESESHQEAAKNLISILPFAPRTLISTSTEAEIFKYTHNCSGFVQIIFFNMMYDLAQKLGADWDIIFDAVKSDPFIPNRYAQPVHKSGRGAGGNCFIKDFEALSKTFERELPKESKIHEVFKANIEKNIELLLVSNKDLNLLAGVYGEGIK